MQQQNSAFLQQRLDAIEQSLEMFTQSTLNDQQQQKEQIYLRKIAFDQLLPFVTIAKENMITNCYKNEELKQTQFEIQQLKNNIDNFQKEINRISEFDKTIYYLEKRLKEKIYDVQGMLLPINSNQDKLQIQFKEFQNTMKSYDIQFQNQNNKIQQNVERIQEQFDKQKQDHYDFVEYINKELNTNQLNFNNIDQQIKDIQQINETFYNRFQLQEQSILDIVSKQYNLEQQINNIHNYNNLEIKNQIEKINEKLLFNDRKINEQYKSLYNIQKSNEKNNEIYIKQFKYTPFETATLVSNFMQEFLCASDQQKLIKFENKLVQDIYGYMQIDISLKEQQVIQNQIINQVIKEGKGLYKIEFNNDFNKNNLESKNNSNIELKIQNFLAGKNKQIFEILKFDQRVIDAKNIFKNIQNKQHIQSFQKTIERLDKIQTQEIEIEEQQQIQDEIILKNKELLQEPQPKNFTKLNTFHMLNFGLKFVEKNYGNSHSSNYSDEHSKEIKKKIINNLNNQLSESVDSVHQSFIEDQNSEQRNLNLNFKAQNIKKFPQLNISNSQTEKSNHYLNVEYKDKNASKIIQNLNKKDEEQLNFLNQIFQTLLNKIMEIQTVQKSMLQFNQLFKFINSNATDQETYNFEEQISQNKVNNQIQKSDDVELIQNKQQIYDKMDLEVMDKIFSIMEEKNKNDHENQKELLNQLDKIFIRNLNCSKCGFQNSNLDQASELNRAQLNHNHFNGSSKNLLDDIYRNKNTDSYNYNYMGSGLSNICTQVIYIKSVAKIDKLKSRYMMKKRKWILNQINPAKRYFKQLQQENFLKQKEIENMLEISDDEVQEGIQNNQDENTQSDQQYSQDSLQIQKILNQSQQVQRDVQQPVIDYDQKIRKNRKISDELVSSHNIPEEEQKGQEGKINNIFKQKTYKQQISFKKTIFMDKYLNSQNENKTNTIITEQLSQQSLKSCESNVDKEQQINKKQLKTIRGDIQVQNQIGKYIAHREQVKKNLMILENQIAKMLIFDIQKSSKSQNDNPFTMKKILQTQLGQFKLNELQVQLFEDIESQKLTLDQAKQKYKEYIKQFVTQQDDGRNLAFQNLGQNPGFQTFNMNFGVQYNQDIHIKSQTQINNIQVPAPTYILKQSTLANQQQINSHAKDNQQALIQANKQQNDIEQRQDSMIDQLKQKFQDDIKTQLKFEKIQNHKILDKFSKKIEKLQENIDFNYNEKLLKDKQFDSTHSQQQQKINDCCKQIEQLQSEINRMEKAGNENKKYLQEFILELKLEYFEFFKQKKQGKSSIMTILNSQDEDLKYLKNVVQNSVAAQNNFQNLIQVIAEHSNYINSVIINDITTRKKLQSNLKSASQSLSKDQYLNSLITKKKENNTFNLFQQANKEKENEGELQVLSQEKSIHQTKQDIKDTNNQQQIEGFLFLQQMEYRNKKLNTNKIIEHLQTFSEQINKIYFQISEQLIQIQKSQEVKTDQSQFIHYSNIIHSQQIHDKKYEFLPQRIFDDIYLEKNITYNIKYPCSVQSQQNGIQDTIPQSRKSVYVNLKTNYTQSPPPQQTDKEKRPFSQKENKPHKQYEKISSNTDDMIDLSALSKHSFKNEIKNKNLINNRNNLHSGVKFSNQINKVQSANQIFLKSVPNQQDKAIYEKMKSQEISQTNKSQKSFYSQGNYNQHMKKQKNHQMINIETKDIYQTEQLSASNLNLMFKKNNGMICSRNMIQRPISSQAEMQNHRKSVNILSSKTGPQQTLIDVQLSIVGKQNLLQNNHTNQLILKSNPSITLNSMQIKNNAYIKIRRGSARNKFEQQQS